MIDSKPDVTRRRRRMSFPGRRRPRNKRSHELAKARIMLSQSDEPVVELPAPKEPRVHLARETYFQRCTRIDEDRQKCALWQREQQARFATA